VPAAALVEELGYGTFWLGGSPRLSEVRPLLEGSERLVVGTGIVNIWAYEPAQLSAEYAELAADFADRLIVGIGVGHPEATQEHAKPLSAMREFLDGIDAAATPIPREHRCLAALGPKMLDLAAERSLGAIPYFVHADHARAARERLGPGPLLAPEAAYVIDEDEERGRAPARKYAALYLGLGNYANNLLAHGFEEADVRGGDPRPPRGGRGPRLRAGARRAGRAARALERPRPRPVRLRALRRWPAASPR
jgi:probable F420-dependent oxidoreductase